MPSPQFVPSATFKGGLIGAVGAGVVNIGIYFAALAAGAGYQIESGGQQMTIPPFMPMVNSLGAGLIGPAILLGVCRLAPEKAWTIFLGISALVFAGFGAMPCLMLSNDTVGIVSLEVMHVVTVVGVLGGIWKHGRA